MANQPMAVRHIAPASHSSRVALGAFEKSVEVWDLEAGTRIAQLQTILDFGGTRLELAPAGDRLFAACYDEADVGVAAYDVTSGERLWHRRQLRRAQQIRASNHGEYLYACLEDGPCHLLDAATGKTIERLHDVRRIYVAPNSEHLFLSGSRARVTTVEGDRLFGVSQETFAFLDAAFSETLLCTSESGGAVRAFDLVSGELRWRYVPSTGNHVLNLGYARVDEALFAIEWSYENGGERILIRLEHATGAASRVVSIGQCAETAFLAARGLVISSDRTAYRLTDGSVAMLFR